jgi:hypothetical protein
MIKTINEESTTEVLFYFALHSFLLQRTDFKDKFEMLRNQYQEHPTTFKIFSKPQLLWIKKMQDSYKTNSFTLFEEVPLCLEKYTPPRGSKSEQKHHDLCMDIWKNRTTTIEPYTGPIDSTCYEFPVIYGNIDLLVQSKRIIHIIEVKTETATHAIVGQVMKYYVGMCLKLFLKLFDEIKMITICPGYDQASFDGLRQIGATPLIIDSKSLIVKNALSYTK